MKSFIHEQNSHHSTELFFQQNTSFFLHIPRERRLSGHLIFWSGTVIGIRMCGRSSCFRRWGNVWSVSMILARDKNRKCIFRSSRGKGGQKNQLRNHRGSLKPESRNRVSWSQRQLGTLCGVTRLVCNPGPKDTGDCRTVKPRSAAHCTRSHGLCTPISSQSLAMGPWGRSFPKSELWLYHL